MKRTRESDSASSSLQKTLGRMLLRDTNPTRLFSAGRLRISETGESFWSLIRASEFSKERTKDLSKLVKIGDEVIAQVIGFERGKRQINLSKKQYDERVEKERVSNFLSSQGEGSIKLGDVLGDKLKSLIKE